MFASTFPWLESKLKLLLLSDFTVVPFSCVHSCRPFIVSTTSSPGLVGVKVSSVARPGQLTAGVQITDCPGRVTEETSTPNKTCQRCHRNYERLTWTNTTNRMVKPENKDNSNFDSNWNLPINAWNMIFKNISFHDW